MVRGMGFLLLLNHYSPIQLKEETMKFLLRIGEQNGYAVCRRKLLHCSWGGLNYL